MHVFQIAYNISQNDPHWMKNRTRVSASAKNGPESHHLLFDNTLRNRCFLVHIFIKKSRNGQHIQEECWAVASQSSMHVPDTLNMNCNQILQNNPEFYLLSLPLWLSSHTSYPLVSNSMRTRVYGVCPIQWLAAKLFLLSVIFTMLCFLFWSVVPSSLSQRAKFLVVH